MRRCTSRVSRCLESLCGEGSLLPGSLQGYSLPVHFCTYRWGAHSRLEISAADYAKPFHHCVQETHSPTVRDR